MLARFVTSSEHSYMIPAVESLLLGSLPDVEVDNKELVVDKLTKAIVNTRQVRLTGSPNPESLVLIREVIRWAMDAKQPIPILIASGPKKPGAFANIDVAELSALKILKCLNHQVRRWHVPGIHVRIRLEDETGYYLEGNTNEVRKTIQSYCMGFVALSAVLNDESLFLQPFMESTKSEGEMTEKAKELHPVFVGVMCGTLPLRSLHDLGWKGPLSDALIKNLDDRYEKLQLGGDYNGRKSLAAKYLANTLARKLVGATGWDEEWAPKGALEVSFAAPMPNSPTVSRRVHYRTVPLRCSRLHLPYWRSRGMLKVEAETAKFCLRHWYDQVKLIGGNIVLKRDEAEVCIDAPVLIEG